MDSEEKVVQVVTPEVTSSIRKTHLLTILPQSVSKSTIMLMNLDPLSSSGIDDGEPGGTTTPPREVKH